MELGEEEIGVLRNFERETGDPLGRPSRVFNLLNGVQGARSLPAGGILPYL